MSLMTEISSESVSLLVKYLFLLKIEYEKLFLAFT